MAYLRDGFVHIWDPTKCPLYRGGLASGVAFMRGPTVIIMSDKLTVPQVYRVVDQLQYSYKP